MRHLSFHVRELLSVLVLSGVPYLFWIGQTYALTTLADRSIAISTGTPSAVATHIIQLTPITSGQVGSIKLQYCSNSQLFELPCTPPTGLSLSGASLDSQTGNTGFSIDTADSDTNTLLLSRPSSPTNLVSSVYSFSGLVNPSVSNQTTYVRISTYSSSDASGSYVDRGAVAFSTQTNFEVGAYIPPFLNICAGVTVAPDCNQTQGDSLDLGVLSPASTRTATSQYAASTNDVAGCSVYLLGTTMTSGNNIIPALDNIAASRTGLGEFGLNLRRNNNPTGGNDPSGNGTSVPAPEYNSPNLFSFVPGSEISSSTESTDYNRMTVTYITNVPASQPAGIYSTTLTYLASAQF